MGETLNLSELNHSMLQEVYGVELKSSKIVDTSILSLTNNLPSRDRLHHILLISYEFLLKLDSHTQYFTYPVRVYLVEFLFVQVTDEMAPGYTKLIKEPMDLSKIYNRLVHHKYKNFESFESDLKLMFTNCCTFNGKDSIYSQV